MDWNLRRDNRIVLRIIFLSSMKKFTYFGVVVAILLISSCSKETTKIPITNLALIPDGVMLSVGGNDTLKATYSPLNATDKTLIWSSTDKSIVTVNDSGKIVAIAPGKAKIKVSSSDKSLEAICEVIVTKCDKYLNGNRISSLAIDNQGNIWGGSLGGIVFKFDGHSWSNFSFWSDSPLQTVIIYDIAVDSNNNLWFATSIGLSKFNGISLENYNYLNSGLPNDFITEIVFEGQNLWIGTMNSGVIEFDGSNWKAYNTTNSGLGFNTINKIVIDKLGRKWICTNSGGVSIFDNTNWTTYNPLNSGLLNQWVTALCIDKNDNKWIGSSGGVSLFNGTNWTNYTTLSFVQDIIIDELGNKWFCTGGSGVFKFNGTNWTNFTKENCGLSSDVVYEIIIDKLGRKWLGTNDGISVLQD